ncbi:hypothetical protein C8Q80DRAFT_1272060 [Daedaleopsis nitida]|nr:hypothetical protein C8Q80DRAFT_1272060 [Daedaleopsis nitida]
MHSMLGDRESVPSPANASTDPQLRILIASCADPSHEALSAIWTTFAHVAEDLARFRAREATADRSAAPNPKHVLNSHHTLSGPAARVTLLPEGADTTSVRARASICRMCKALTAAICSTAPLTVHGLELPETPEGIVHHLCGW